MSFTSPEMDNTLKCIALVQDRPQQWQKEHREFMNRAIRNKLFKELAQMCGLPCVSRCHTQAIVRIDLFLRKAYMWASDCVRVCVCVCVCVCVDKCVCKHVVSASLHVHEHTHTHIHTHTHTRTCVCVCVCVCVLFFVFFCMCVCVLWCFVCGWVEGKSVSVHWKGENGIPQESSDCWITQGPNGWVACYLHINWIWLTKTERSLFETVNQKWHQQDSAWCCAVATTARYPATSHYLRANLLSQFCTDCCGPCLLVQCQTML